MPHRLIPRRLIPILLLALLSACRTEEPPALVVGDIRFTATEVGGLSSAQKDSLVDVAAFGQVVSDAAVRELVEPVHDHFQARSHLQSSRITSVLGGSVSPMRLSRRRISDRRSGS